MNTINNYRDVIFLKLFNPTAKKYANVLKELKEKFKIFRTHEKLMSELLDLNWVETKEINNYNNEVLNMFEENDNRLQNKLQKYKNICTKIERDIDLNNKTKHTILNKNIDKDCKICYKSDQDDFAITRCGHIFCKKCISTCIITKFQCPICRTIIFNSDILYFSKDVYNFLGTHKILLPDNNLLESSIDLENTNIFLPPHANVLLRNPYEKSILIHIKNITNQNQLEFDDFMNYENFLSTIKLVENNIKETYNNKIKKLAKLFIELLRIRTTSPTNQ